MKEIAIELKVAKSSVSQWVRNIPLSNAAKRRIEMLYTNGQLAAQASHRAATRDKEDIAAKEARDILSRVHDQKEVRQLMCALLYWCEGAKLYNNKGNLSFANSDPDLVAAFLSLFRSSFELDESKFHPCIHIHGYHNEETQLKFWSKVTNIPIGQFIRSFRKQESGKSIRNGYQGCIQVRYYDKLVLRKLLAIAREFLKKPGP